LHRSRRDESLFARIRVNSVTGVGGSVILSLVPDPLDLARERLERLLGLDPVRARRAVTEMIDCFGWQVDEFIAERHRELQARGVRNDAIYETIAREIPTLRFAAPKLSARQIRRRIYG
jgi:hypothetical protein